MTHSLPDSSRVARSIYTAFDTHYDDLAFDAEDVESLVETFRSTDLEHQDLREGVAERLWTRTDTDGDLPHAICERVRAPPTIDDESLTHLDTRYSDERKNHLRDIKQSKFPLEVEQAIDELVEEGIRGFQGTQLTDYALVDILLEFQDHLYEFTDAFNPLEVHHNDGEAAELLFDDASHVYYCVEVPWDMERRFDKWMCILSTGAASIVMQRAAEIRARESYNSGELRQRIGSDDVVVMLALDLNRIPPALST